MFKLAIISLSLMVSSLASARNGGGGRLPTCTGHEPPRLGAEYTRNPSFDAKIAAYQKLLESYNTEHPDAAEFQTNLREIEGRSCLDDEDCSTSDESKFSGSCERYVWEGTNGICRVNSKIPVPTPPAKPVVTCADVTCPGDFQCEVENQTLAVGCVAPRTCVQPRR